jgi:hypothetical protein
MEREFLSLQEATVWFGLSPRSLRDLARAGKVPGLLRPGRKYLFHRPTIEAAVYKGEGKREEQATAPH